MADTIGSGGVEPQQQPPPPLLVEKKKAVIPHHNRQFQREQLVQQQQRQQSPPPLRQNNSNNNANKARGHKRPAKPKREGFEYALLPNGALMAEDLWQRQQPPDGVRRAFQPTTTTTTTTTLWSLQKLQQALRQAQTRYQQSVRLPPPPLPQKEPSSNISYNNHNSSTASGTVPAPVVSSLSSASPTTTWNNTNSNNNTTTTKTNNLVATVTKHSNPYAPPVPPPPTNNHHNNTNTAASFGMDYDDDDLDAVLATMDDDMLLSSMKTTKTATHSLLPSKSAPVIIDVDATSHPNPNHSSAYGNNNYGNHHTPDHNNHSIPQCPGHGQACQILTTRQGPNAGRQFYKCAQPTPDQQCPFFQWLDDSSSNGGNGGGNGTVNTYRSNHDYQQNNSYNNNGYGSYPNHDDPFHRGNSHHDKTPSNVPLCPEHQLPCIVLTSNSAKNPGRQFYKCSQPQRSDQCDFFEWVDGGVGNSSNSNSNGNYNSGGGGDYNNAYHGDGGDYHTYSGNSSNHGSSSFYDNNNYNNTSTGATTMTTTTTWKQSILPGASDFRPLPGCRDIHVENRKIFGHKTFRPGQQLIIEQAVSGRDVFVLMPTGGGKSLCYQLPAWCCPGLSIVISPLLSLIQDQVQSMKKLGVEAVFLNSSQDYETEQREINRRLSATTAHEGISLLYITPEKLRHSGALQQMLTRLYQNNLLSRFVVDEAHCLSDWGHDFRPDYATLHTLRESYPNVPLMALTATANQKVVDDAISALRMKRDCYLYRSSFNRPNLHYEVRKKDGKADDSICDYIVQQHKENHHCSGVIYCLSRKDCEKLSEKLQDKLNKRGRYSIKISYYHAELSAEDRAYRHSEWSKGNISVLCATIAFGMGIDKPDVRFVIHYSMPKSITHYYQESGRAGRDGEKADCILYYSYKDKQVLEGMIKKSASNPNSQSTRRKVDQLYTCLRYCEDEFRCRRTMQLEFFGEAFHRSKCRGTCDNCREDREVDKRDLTEVANVLLSLLAAIQSHKRRSGLGATLLQLTELFRGSKTKAITKSLPNYLRLPGYGHATRYNLKKKADIDRIAHAMIFERILVEVSEQNKQGFSCDYVQTGEHADAIRNGQRKFFVEFPKDKPKADGKENSKPNKAKTKSPKKAKSKSNQNSTKNKKTITPLHDDSDGESEAGLSTTVDPSIPNAVLPPAYALQLKKQITKAVGLWAEEEQMLGSEAVYSWHIMTNKVIKTVAAQCPTTLDELEAVDGLGEQKFKEYGVRLIRIINAFVEAENLQEHLEKKKNSQSGRKRKASAPQPTVVTGMGTKIAKVNATSQGNLATTVSKDDDEFPLDFDLSGIVLPGDKPSAADASKSKYF